MFKKENLKFRLIALFLSFSFLLSDLAYAAPEIVRNFGDSLRPIDVAAADLSRFEAPLDFSNLQEYHQGDRDKPLIIHIQDAHSNYSGQQNLADTLNYLIEKYSVSTVLVEGSAIDATLTPLRRILPSEEGRRTAKSLLMEGQIAGEEYLNLTSSHDLRILGVEDEELYFRSLRAYAELADRRESTFRYLHKIRAAIEKLKSRHYPAELLDYERSAGESRDAEKIKKLLRLCASVGADLRSCPNLLKIRALYEREASIDFTRANLEQAHLIEEIQKRGSGEDFERQLQKMSQARGTKASQSSHFQNVLNTALQKNISLSGYSNLQRYGDYLKEYSSLEIDRLLEEIQKAEDHAYRSILVEKDPKLIRSIDRYLALLETACQIRMTSEEFKIFQANEPDFATVSFLAFINRKLADNGYFGDLIPLADMLEESRKSLTAFYDSVSQRDEAFLWNAKRLLEGGRQKAVVLISGGYHTRHLKQLFRRDGYGYVVLTPIVTQETDQKKYEELLLSPIRKGVRTVEVTPDRKADAPLSALGGIRAGKGRDGIKFLGLASRIKSEGRAGVAASRLSALADPAKIAAVLDGIRSKSSNPPFPGAAARPAPIEGGRLALADKLASFGIKASGGILDFSGVPPDAVWVMDRIRDKETGSIITDPAAMPAADFKIGADDMILLSDEGLNSRGVFLGLATVDGAEVPAIYKALAPGSGYDEEFVLAQIHGKLGVAPRFYGVVRNDQGDITGYAMQLCIGETISTFSGDPDSEHYADFVRMTERLVSAGIMLGTGFVKTRAGGMVKIDSGNSRIVFREMYDEYIRSMNTPQGSRLAQDTQTAFDARLEQVRALLEKRDDVIGAMLPVSGSADERLKIFRDRLASHEISDGSRTVDLNKMLKDLVALGRSDGFSNPDISLGDRNPAVVALDALLAQLQGGRTLDEEGIRRSARMALDYYLLQPLIYLSLRLWVKDEAGMTQPDANFDALQSLLSGLPVSGTEELLSLATSNFAPEPSYVELSKKIALLNDAHRTPLALLSVRTLSAHLRFQLTEERPEGLTRTMRLAIQFGNKLDYFLLFENLAYLFERYDRLGAGNAGVEKNRIVEAILLGIAAEPELYAKTASRAPSFLAAFDMQTLFERYQALLGKHRKNLALEMRSFDPSDKPFSALSYSHLFSLSALHRRELVALSGAGIRPINYFRLLSAIPEASGETLEFKAEWARELALESTRSRNAVIVYRRDDALPLFTQVTEALEGARLSAYQWLESLIPEGMPDRDKIVANYAKMPGLIAGYNEGARRVIESLRGKGIVFSISEIDKRDVRNVEAKLGLDSIVSTIMEAADAIGAKEEEPLRVLDVGAGKGVFLADIYNQLPDAYRKRVRLTGIEPYPVEEPYLGAIERSGIDWRRGLFEFQKLADYGGKGFHLIYGTEVLQYAYDGRAFLDRASEFLAEGGQAVIGNSGELSYSGKIDGYNSRQGRVFIEKGRPAVWNIPRGSRLAFKADFSSIAASVITAIDGSTFKALENFFLGGAGAEWIERWAASSDRKTEDIKELNLQRIGSGEYREVFLLTASFGEKAEPLRAVVKIAKDRRNSTLSHQAVEVRARRDLGIAGPLEGVWTLSNGIPIALVHWKAAEQWKTYFRTPRDSRADESGRALSWMRATAPAVFETWRRTGTIQPIDGMYPSQHIFIASSGRPSGWEAEPVDLGSMPLRDGAALTLEDGEPVYRIEGKIVQGRDLFAPVSLAAVQREVEAMAGWLPPNERSAYLEGVRALAADYAEQTRDEDRPVDGGADELAALVIKKMKADLMDGARLADTEAASVARIAEKQEDAARLAWQAPFYEEFVRDLMYAVAVQKDHGIETELDQVELKWEESFLRDFEILGTYVLDRDLLYRMQAQAARYHRSYSDSLSMAGMHVSGEVGRWLKDVQAQGLTLKEMSFIGSSVRNIAQHAQGNGLVLALRHRPGASQGADSRVHVYIFDNGPGMPVSEVMQGRFKAGTSIYGMDLEALAKQRGNSYFIESGGERWDGATGQTEKVEREIPRGVLVGISLDGAEGGRLAGPVDLTELKSRDLSIDVVEYDREKTNRALWAFRESMERAGLHRPYIGFGRDSGVARIPEDLLANQYQEYRFEGSAVAIRVFDVLSFDPGMSAPGAYPLRHFIYSIHAGDKIVGHGTMFLGDEPGQVMFRFSIHGGTLSQAAGGEDYRSRGYGRAALELTMAAVIKGDMFKGWTPPASKLTYFFVNDLAGNTRRQEFESMERLLRRAGFEGPAEKLTFDLSMKPKEDPAEDGARLAAASSQLADDNAKFFREKLEKMSESSARTDWLDLQVYLTFDYRGKLTDVSWLAAEPAEGQVTFPVSAVGKAPLASVRTRMNDAFVSEFMDKNPQSGFNRMPAGDFGLFKGQVSLTFKRINRWAFFKGPLPAERGSILAHNTAFIRDTLKEEGASSGSFFVLSDAKGRIVTAGHSYSMQRADEFFEGSSADLVRAEIRTLPEGGFETADPFIRWPEALAVQPAKIAVPAQRSLDPNIPILNTVSQEPLDVERRSIAMLLADSVRDGYQAFRDSFKAGGQGARLTDSLSADVPDFAEAARQLREGDLRQKIIAAAAIEGWASLSGVSAPAGSDAEAVASGLQNMLALSEGQAPAISAMRALIGDSALSRKNTALTSSFFPFLAETVKVSQLKSVWASMGQTYDSRDAFRASVDPPIAEACAILYEKGILSYTSSANGRDAEAGAYIGLVVPNLTIENKMILDGLTERGVFNRDTSRLQFPFTSETSVSELSRRAAAIASLFSDQTARFKVGDRVDDPYLRYGEGLVTAVNGRKVAIRFSNVAEVTEIFDVSVLGSRLAIGAPQRDRGEIAVGSTDRFQRALRARLTASSLESLDQARKDEESILLLAAAYAAQPKEFIGRFFSFRFTGAGRNAIVRFIETGGVVYAEFYSSSGYRRSPRRMLGRVLVDNIFVERARTSASRILRAAPDAGDAAGLMRQVAENMDQILLDDVVRMARTALKIAGQASGGTGSETVVYNQALDIDLRLEVPANFSEAKREVYRGWVERIQAAFKSEGRIFVQFAAPGESFAEIRGAAVIDSGVLSESLLRNASGHGISAVAAGSFDEAAASFIPRTVFAVLVQRLNRPTEPLKNLWRNIRSNPLTDLSPDVFEDLKTVRAGATIAAYQKLSVKTARLAWNQIVNAARLALQAVGSAA